MTTYAIIEESGRIVSAADWAFPDAQPVDRDIVHGWDGALYYVDDPARRLPLDVAKERALAAVEHGYEAALVAAITMPLLEPSAQTVAVETSALLAVDPDALDSIKAVLDLRRTALVAAVEAAETLDELQALVISYPV